LNSKKQELQELLKQTFDLKTEARFQNSLEKVIWVLFQKIEKASEISPTRVPYTKSSTVKFEIQSQIEL
jgi:hypothetical protein